MKCLCSVEDGEEQLTEGMSPKVVEVYKSVGKIMSRYSAGKVPKAFKIIPNLKQWEEVRRPADLQTCLPSHRLTETSTGCSVVRSATFTAQQWPISWPAVLQRELC